MSALLFKVSSLLVMVTLIAKVNWFYSVKFLHFGG